MHWNHHNGPKQRNILYVEYFVLKLKLTLNLEDKWSALPSLLLNFSCIFQDFIIVAVGPVTHANSHWIKYTLACTLSLTNPDMHIFTQSYADTNTHIHMNTTPPHTQWKCSRLISVKIVLPPLTLCSSLLTLRDEKISSSLPFHLSLLVPPQRRRTECIQPSHLDSWDFSPPIFPLQLSVSNHSVWVKSYIWGLFTPNVFGAYSPKPWSVWSFNSVCLAWWG